MSGIKLESISRTFGSQRVLDDVSVEVAAHEFVTLLGPSGCGKSTLLNIAAGLEQPTAGKVCIGGRDVTALNARERNIAMVFQSYALYPHMTVAQNLAFPLRIQKVPRAQIEQRVRAVAETIEIGGLLDRKPGQLSGGQRQRVAIGRAIIRSPSICLLDEPLSNIDAALRVRMRSELKLLFNKMGTTILFVTHDQVEAMTLSDRIIVLNGGKVQQQGTPLEIYRNPANAFVARFIGSPQMNILPAQIESGPVVRAQSLVLPLDGSATQSAPIPSAAGGAVARVPERGEVQLGLRPEDIQLSAFPRSVRVAASATLVEHLGYGAIIHYAIEGLPPIVGLESRETNIRPGWRGDIHINLDGVRLFCASTGVALRSGA